MFASVARSFLDLLEGRATDKNNAAIKRPKIAAIAQMVNFSEATAFK